MLFFPNKINDQSEEGRRGGGMSPRQAMRCEGNF